jgi:hypothetical protein
MQPEKQDRRASLTMQLWRSIALFLGSASSIVWASEAGLRVIFPNFQLEKNVELLERVHLVVKCGHIESVSAIPAGWSISVVRMNTGVEELRAETEHGASRLWSLGRFNGGIRVVPGDARCFDLVASVVVSGATTREIELKRRNIKLAP